MSELWIDEIATWVEIDEVVKGVKSGYTLEQKNLSDSYFGFVLPKFADQEPVCRTLKTHNSGAGLKELSIEVL